MASRLPSAGVASLVALSLSLTLNAAQADTRPEAPLPPLTAPSNSLDPSLGAEEFEALTQGKTFDTHDAESGLYGIETFYPNNQVIWQDAEGCVAGSWYASGPQICFNYDGGSNNPVCWSYHNRNGWIMGWFRGDRSSVPIMLYPSTGPKVTCDAYFGS